MYQMDAKDYNENVMKGLFRKIYPFIAHQITERTNIREGFCLDLGGGPGMLGISIAEITTLNVVIYDLLPECIEEAQKNIEERGLKQRVSARQGKAEDIVFPDNSIDLVISRGSVFFWEDQKKGLCEAYRVLKPGGWAYIGGGMGSVDLLLEVQMERAKNPQFAEKGDNKRIPNPPGHFENILKECNIPGSIVENSMAGTWIIFQKTSLK
jgi:ubiquinone/menaquinone biosynthesis C-methylase UbiE